MDRLLIIIAPFQQENREEMRHRGRGWDLNIQEFKIHTSVNHFRFKCHLAHFPFLLWTVFMINILNTVEVWHTNLIHSVNFCICKLLSKN